MSARLPLPPGALLAGDYVIESLLSEGGMGQVYVALQRSTGKRRAVKVMLPRALADERLRERFVQEARAAAGIDSEHVVEVIGAGVDDGLPWLAMELLRGQHLGDHLASLPARRVGVDELRAIVRQLGHGLALAHRAGIVHRDLKPENIFRAEARSLDRPFVIKILDFGIAHIRREADAAGATAAVGSPLWLAPEQLEDGGALSPAADVWSLGLLCFWLLTGTSYWLTASRGERSVPRLLTEIVTRPLVAPSVRLAELGVSLALPAGFDAWFARCVQRDPRARFADADQACRGLEEALGGWAQTAAPPSSPPVVSPRPAHPPQTYLGTPTFAPGPAAAPAFAPTPAAPAHASPASAFAPVSAAIAPGGSPPPGSSLVPTTPMDAGSRHRTYFDPGATFAPSGGAAGVAPGVGARVAPTGEVRPPGSRTWQRLGLALGLAGALAAGGVALALSLASSDGVAPRPGGSATATVSAGRAPGASAGAAAAGAAGGLASARAGGPASAAASAAAVQLLPARTPPREGSGEMVSIEGGSFMMGSAQGEPDERPPRPVTVATFELDVTEVTTAAYEACAAQGGCSPAASGGLCNAGVAERRSHPINCVDWQQSATFCAWAGKRLPTEVEWEYAARGGPEARIYPWGAGPAQRQLCWDGGGEPRRGTCPAGSYPAGKSRHGVLDLAGNVSEWTASPYCAHDVCNWPVNTDPNATVQGHCTTADEPRCWSLGCDVSRDPLCAQKPRVHRGVSWYSGAGPQAMLRGSLRGKDAAGAQSGLRGLRCARTP